MKFMKYVKIISPPDAPHVWYYKHVGEVYQVTTAHYDNLWKVIDIDKEIRLGLVKEGVNIDFNRDIYINKEDCEILEYMYRDEINKILEI